MSDILLKDFNMGWIPNVNEQNGPKNALVRMQNLCLDEDGAVSLVNGTTKIHSTQLGGVPHSIYSKYIGLTKYRIVGLDNGEQYINTGVGDEFTTLLFSSGSTWKSTFSTAYDFIIHCGGIRKMKYCATGNFQLGVGKPTAAPTCTSNSPYYVDCTGTIGSWTSEEGTQTTSTYVEVVGDATTFRGASYLGSLTLNTKNLSTGVGGENDTFGMQFYADIPDLVTRISIEFILDTDPINYYKFTWEITDELRSGLGVWTTLTCDRSSFTRYGGDLTKNWTNVAKVRVVFEATDVVTARWKNIFFQGGTLGSLDGEYEYCQINVATRSGYTAKSPGGPVARVELRKTSGHIVTQTPTTGDIQSTNCWIFRRGGKLSRWYRVKDVVGATSATFEDQLSDEDAIRIGIVLNEDLLAVKDISEDFVDIVGPWYNRWLYFSYKSIFISQDGNPDAYDSLKGVINPCGTSGEFILWAKKVGNSVIYVGTTSDIYEISGTMAELPDGTIDYRIRALGTANPPVNDAVAVDGEILFYFANKGIRVLGGSQTQQLNENLELLFKGQDRYSVSAINTRAVNQDTYAMAVSKGKLFCVMSNASSVKQTYVFDLIKKYWYEYKTNTSTYNGPASALYTEEDGTLLAGYQDSGDRFIRQIDWYRAAGQQLDATAKIPIVFKTVFVTGESIYNRKDSLYLKLHIATGSDNATVKITYESGGTFTTATLPVFATGTSPTEYVADISSLVGVVKRYQVEITGSFNIFKVVDLSIGYENRPEQTTYVRTVPTDFGTPGRKRMSEVAFSIDTLGNTITVTPYLDGVAEPSFTVNNNGKKTFAWTPSMVKICSTFHFTFQGATNSYFEFYELLQPKVIEVLPDPVKALVIPATNLGTHARKRFFCFAFTINTNGKDVTFVPSIDLVAKTALVVNTAEKQTVRYFFLVEEQGIDIGGTLVGVDTFEFYGVNLEECVSEKLPPQAKFTVIPPSNLGTHARKRLTAFAFVINTMGQNVLFTPSIDGIAWAPLIVNTNFKKTVIYYFTTEAIGVDISVILSSSSVFEYYGISLDECISEKLPAAVEFLTIPVSNLGSPNRKRIRTIPLVIYTYGRPVSYTPTIDGVVYPSQTFTTTSKRTVFYYFTSDVFGVDVGGTLNGTNPFEFYGIQNPEIVEILPIQKLYDQVGPWEFNKLAKIYGFRARFIALGTSIGYRIFCDDVSVCVGTIPTYPNQDVVYDIPRLPKNINGSTCRIEYSSDQPFHRLSTQILCAISGSTTGNRWVGEPRANS